MAEVVIIGGTAGIGRVLAEHYIGRGRSVTITGRDPERTASIAAEIGATGIAFDLGDPASIAPALAGVGEVDRLVLGAIERDANSVRDYNIEGAIRLVTIKLVGYTETVHALADRFTDDASVVLYGGRAKDRPYPGSTTVTTINGGVQAMVVTLATELAPVRVNALHPGIVGDSPFWENKPLDAVIARTPTKRLATMDDIVDATVFLLENRSVNGIDLYVDGGWMLM